MAVQLLRVPFGLRGTHRRAEWVLADGKRTWHGVVAGGEPETKLGIVDQIAEGAVGAGWDVWYLRSVQDEAPCAVSSLAARTFAADGRYADRAIAELMIEAESVGEPARVLVVLRDPRRLFAGRRWSRAYLRTLQSHGVATLAVTDDLWPSSFGDNVQVRDSLVEDNLVHTRAVGSDAMCSWKFLNVWVESLPAGRGAVYVREGGGPVYTAQYEAGL